MTNTVERVEVKGKRTYKSNRPKPPITQLIPTAVDTLRLLFASNGEAPSVTTVLGVLAKPALIGWAAREERKMVAALAAKLYTELASTIEGQIAPDMFISLLNDKLGKGAHLQLLAKASNVGSQVHARIEWEFKQELELPSPDEPPALTSDQAVRAFKRWTEWRAQVKLNVLAIEKRLYSALFGYGGTLDLLAELDVNDAAADSPFPHIVRQTVVLDFKTGKSIYAESYLQNVAYRMALQEEGIATDGGWIVRLPKYDDDPEFDAQPVPHDPLLAPTFLALLLVYKWWETAHPPRKSKRTPSNTVDKHSTSVLQLDGVETPTEAA